MNASDILTATTEASSGVENQDVVVGAGYVGTRWTKGSSTGLTMHRLEDGLIVRSWNAAQTADAGPSASSGRSADR